ALLCAPAPPGRTPFPYTTLFRSAGALRQAEVRPARPAGAARPFGATVLEDVLDACRAARPVFRAAARKPGIARALGRVFAGRRRRAFVAGAVSAVAARGLAPWAALARHRQSDPFNPPTRSFHASLYKVRSRKEQSERTFSQRHAGLRALGPVFAAQAVAGREDRP